MHYVIKTLSLGFSPLRNVSKHITEINLSGLKFCALSVSVEITKIFYLKRVKVVPGKGPKNKCSSGLYIKVSNSQSGVVIVNW